MHKEEEIFFIELVLASPVWVTLLIGVSEAVSVREY
jgi:hypothetical protein